MFLYFLYKFVRNENLLNFDKTLINTHHDLSTSLIQIWIGNFYNMLFRFILTSFFSLVIIIVNEHFAIKNATLSLILASLVSSLIRWYLNLKKITTLKLHEGKYFFIYLLLYFVWSFSSHLVFIICFSCVVVLCYFLFQKYSFSFIFFSAKIILMRFHYFEDHLNKLESFFFQYFIFFLFVIGKIFRLSGVIQISRLKMIHKIYHTRNKNEVKIAI